jgi:hypothetical protein
MGGELKGLARVCSFVGPAPMIACQASAPASAQPRPSAAYSRGAPPRVAAAAALPPSIHQPMGLAPLVLPSKFPLLESSVVLQLAAPDRR